jgi:hypothetical protein
MRSIPAVRTVNGLARQRSVSQSIDRAVAGTPKQAAILEHVSAVRTPPATYDLCLAYELCFRQQMEARCTTP